jgi:hypothetical protein
MNWKTYARQISPKELKSLGWEPSGQRRCYQHKAGWTLEHCGHPTALYPYLLRDAAGNVYLTGAAVSGRADFGTAWPTVASAVDFVATQVPEASCASCGMTQQSVRASNASNNYRSSDPICCEVNL